MASLPDDPASEIAGMVASEWLAENYGSEELLAFSLRVPMGRVELIDAMAKRAGVSRNRMANMLLAAGCRDVVSRLPSEVFSELQEEIGGML